MAVELQLLQSLSPEYKIKETTLPNQGFKLEIRIGSSLLHPAVQTPKIKEYIFDIIMDNQFPFSGPLVLARTEFIYPTLHDGRNLLYELVDHPWNPTTTCMDIVKRLPRFIAQVLSDTLFRFHPYGNFTLRTGYDIAAWENMKECSCYKGEEMLTSGHRAPRYVVITDAAILFLEPNSMVKLKGYCILVAWAHLISIKTISRCVDDPNMLIITWRTKLQYQDMEQRFLFRSCDTVIKQLQERLKRIGMITKVSNPIEGYIKESEVTAIEDIDINKLTETIILYETDLSNDLNIDKIQALMSLYQKAIEFCSAYDDRLHQRYVMSLQNLLQREDVQIILNSLQETTTAIPIPTQEEKVEEVQLIELDNQSPTEPTQPKESPKPEISTPEITETQKAHPKTPEKEESKLPEKEESKTPEIVHPKTPEKEHLKTPEKEESKEEPKTPEKIDSKTPEKIDSKTPEKEEPKTSKTPEPKSPEEISPKIIEDNTPKKLEEEENAGDIKNIIGETIGDKKDTIDNVELVESKDELGEKELLLQEDNTHANQGEGENGDSESEILGTAMLPDSKLSKEEEKESKDFDKKEESYKEEEIKDESKKDDEEEEGEEKPITLVDKKDAFSIE